MRKSAIVHGIGHLLLPVIAALFTTSASASLSGETLAQQGGGSVPACMSCHGAQGEGNPAAGFPALAGLSSAYLVKQLHDLANGSRQNAIMGPMAKGLTDAQIQAVASYYSGLKPTSAASGQGDKALLAEGRELAVNGQWNQAMPACVKCHGAGARGVDPVFPSLAGQHASYLANQLKAWQQGQRHNDPSGVMATVAEKLNDQQIQAVAAYLAALPVEGEVPASAQPDIAPAQADGMTGYFQPPLKKDLPDGKFGESVSRGANIFNHTHLDPEASQYVGNGQDCSNCHVNGGRQANAAPMWAAWVRYPMYRGKNDTVNTMAERLRGCFTYSENAPGSAKGKPPAADSQVLVDLMSYMYWQAAGAPTGQKMKGQGYPKLAEPAKPYSAERGKQVFAENCAMCHGDNGQGTLQAKNDYVFPPIWGPHAFNWGAGMHRVNTAAGFIKANMPLGNPGSLSVQQAWDVAAYIDSKPRPQDPRFDGNLEETIKAFHNNRKIDFYGQTVDGYSLGAPGTLEKWMQDHDIN